MQIEIKCLECGKRTMRFETGTIFYNAESRTGEILLKDKIICPKCKKDISDGKCVTKGVTFMFTMMAATMGLAVNKGNGSKIPKHLRGITLINNDYYNKLRETSQARISLVKQF